MPIRTWLYAIAFGVTAAAALLYSGYIFGYALGEDKGNSHYSAEYHEKYAADKIENECLGGDLSERETHDCIEHQVQTSYEHHTAYNDLKAQTRMANWAVIMTIITGLGVVVTTAGVIYVALTLDAAKTANETAHNAVAATEKIGEAQTRGYLIAHDGKLSLGKHICSVHVNFGNIGLTPVISGKMQVALAFFNDESFKDEISIDRPAKFPSIAMGKSEAAMAYWETKVIRGFIEAAWSGDHYLHIKGEVEWIDTFGKSQRANFSLNVVEALKGLDFEKGAEIAAEFNDWKNQS